MAMNPYDVDTSHFDATYVGFDEGFYCFKLALRGQDGFAACMYQMEVSQWLFDQTYGKWHMGNGFPAKDMPKPKLYNPAAADYFVLLERLSDAVLFERAFEVSGLTPSMLE